MTEGELRSDPTLVVYLRAVDLLDVAPDRVMMVAAHEMDIEAASEVDLRAAYVHRSLEWRPDESGPTNTPPDSTAKIGADDLANLTDILDM